MKNKNLKKKKPVLTYAVLILWTIICVFPLYWMFTFSLKENSEIFGENVLGLPKKWLWSNYADALKSGTLSTGSMMDSTIINGFKNRPEKVTFRAVCKIDFLHTSNRYNIINLG